MLHKTRAIALKIIDYTESSIVAHIYTEKFGIQAYLINGAKKPRAKIHVNLLQPLHLLDLVVYHKDGTTLQRIKEAGQHPILKHLPINIEKSTLALFLDEILHKVLRHQQPDEQLFEFLHSSILWLDRTDSSIANFHLVFLLRLSKYLGFFPSRQITKTYFDLTEGSYTSLVPLHPHFLEKRQAELFFIFGESTYQDSNDVRISRADRRELLAKVLLFYRLHIDNFGEVKSLEILEEVFS